jgi:precorrin isomerase
MDNNTKMDHEKVIDYINVLNHNNKKYIKQIEYLTNQITILKDIHAVSDGIYTDNHDSSNKDKFMKIYSKLQLCIKTINNVDIKTIKKEDILNIYNNFTKENLIYLYNNFDDNLN